MPKAVKDAPKPVMEPEVQSTPETEQVADKSSLPVVYEIVKVVEYSTTSEAGPLTAPDIAEMLGWETEEDYIKRMVALNPNSKPIDWMFGDEYHCLNQAKKKVRCWNNAGNRPFDMSWCEDLIHTVLVAQWAGPHTVPGETVNGETIRVSRYKRVLSGQHQGTACKLADEKLHLLRKKKEENKPLTQEEEKILALWEGHEHIFIETLVVYGLSEDERVLRTIDYVKPRTVADMLYTMELFRRNTSVERKEMTRMLAAAINMLWDRTATKGYKTHPEIVGFLERHKRLLKCVEYLFVLNRSAGVGEKTRLDWESQEEYDERQASDLKDGGRKISKLHISAGQGAAMCYLMGCGTDKTAEYADKYRNEAPPSEKNLDWGYWEQARQFWNLLARGSLFSRVRIALNNLMESTPLDEDNEGLGGLLREKLAIIANAWHRYKDSDQWSWEDGEDVPFVDEDLQPNGCLCLSYTNMDDKGQELPEGKKKLVDIADFGGIDYTEGGQAKDTREEAPMPPPPTPEEIEKAKQEALARRAAAEKEKEDKKKRR